MKFLTHAFPPCVLLDSRLVRLVSLVCFMNECSITVPKINIFDHKTYPDIVTSIEYDVSLMVLSRYAPKWLLGSKRFTNDLHMNIETDVPTSVIGSLSAGAKYLPPISLDKSLVMDAWDDFHIRALRSWDRTIVKLVESDDDGLEENKNSNKADTFYRIPVPFAVKDRARPLARDYV